MFRRFRNYFLAGLLVVVPIGVTIWIVWGIFNLFDSWYRHLAVQIGLRDFLQRTHYTVPEYGMGFILTVTLITFIGFMTQIYLGRKLFEAVDKIFLRIPVVSNLYHGLKQVTETLMGRRKKIFESVVLLEYPRKGIYSLGFVTSCDDNLIEPILKKPLLYVFLPTTPNPTSGYFLLVPEAEVILTDLSVEDAMKMIISGGMVSPKKIRKVPLETITIQPTMPNSKKDSMNFSDSISVQSRE